MKNEEFEDLLLNWIKILSYEEFVPNNIKALNFGMFESEEGYIVHLYGSEDYHAKDDSWSYNEDYVPKKRCLEFVQDEIKNLYWEDFQNLIVRGLRSIISSAAQEEIKILNVENITAGFDDGDLIKIK